MSGQDARIDVEYRAIGNLGRPLQDAQKSLTNYADTAQKVHRQTMNASEMEARAQDAANAEIRSRNKAAASQKYKEFRGTAADVAGSRSYEPSGLHGPFRDRASRMVVQQAEAYREGLEAQQVNRNARRLNDRASRMMAARSGVDDLARGNVPIAPRGVFPGGPYGPEITPGMRGRHRGQQAVLDMRRRMSQEAFTETLRTRYAPDRDAREEYEARERWREAQTQQTALRERREREERRQFQERQAQRMGQRGTAEYQARRDERLRGFRDATDPGGRAARAWQDAHTNVGPEITEQQRLAQRMAARRERRALPWNAGAAEERLERIRAQRPQTFGQRLNPFGPKDSWGLGRTAQYAANIYGIGGITAGVTAGVYLWQKSNRDMIEKADKVAEDYDTLSRSLQTQAGFKNKEMPEVQARLARTAMIAAADKTFTYGAAEQLVSSGFSGQEATGGSLTELLKGVNAMLAPAGKKEDPVMLAESVAGYMNSQGIAKDAAGMKSIMSAVQVLYKSTNLKLADFSQFAGEAPALKGKMEMPEQLAMLSLLKDIASTAEESSSVMRNIAIRSETTASSEEKVAALASLGMKPSDIDMDGESFKEVLDRLAKGTEGKSSPVVTNALKKIFEERAVPGIKHLIDNRAELERRTKLAGDDSAYEADAERQSSGPAAAKRRLELEEEEQLKPRAKMDEALKKQLMINARKNGETEFRIAERGLQYDLYRGIGQDRNVAAQAAFGNRDLAGIVATNGYGIIKDLFVEPTSGKDAYNQANRDLAAKGLVPPDELATPNDKLKQAEEQSYEQRRTRARKTYEQNRDKAIAKIEAAKKEDKWAGYFGKQGPSEKAAKAELQGILRREEGRQASENPKAIFPKLKGDEGFDFYHDMNKGERNAERPGMIPKAASVVAPGLGAGAVPKNPEWTAPDTGAAEPPMPVIPIPDFFQPPALPPEPGMTQQVSLLGEIAKHLFDMKTAPPPSPVIVQKSERSQPGSNASLLSNA